MNFLIIWIAELVLKVSEHATYSHINNTNRCCDQAKPSSNIIYYMYIYYMAFECSTVNRYTSISLHPHNVCLKVWWTENRLLPYRFLRYQVRHSRQASPFLLFPASPDIWHNDRTVACYFLYRCTPLRYNNQIRIGFHQRKYTYKQYFFNCNVPKVHESQV